MTIQSELEAAGSQGLSIEQLARKLMTSPVSIRNELIRMLDHGLAIPMDHAHQPWSQRWQAVDPPPDSRTWEQQAQSLSEQVTILRQTLEMVAKLAEGNIKDIAERGLRYADKRANP